MLGHAMRSIASAVPSRLYSFVLLAALALFASSCRTARTTQRTQTVERRKDSSASVSLMEAINRTETRGMWTQPIGSDTTRLKLPTDLIAKLPKGAVFESKTGRANVKAWLEQDDDEEKPPNVVIEASCDSLELLVYWYESAYDSILHRCDSLERTGLESDSNDIVTKSKTKEPPLWVIMGGEALVIFLVYLYAKTKVKSSKE